jgi:hypothetical protein
MIFFFQESTVVLTLKKPQTSKKVGWSQDTVDNEHLGRKKSKCKSRSLNGKVVIFSINRF